MPDPIGEKQSNRSPKTNGNGAEITQEMHRRLVLREQAGDKGPMKTISGRAADATLLDGKPGLENKD